MKRFLTLQRLVSIIAVVCSSQIFPILEFSTSRVSFIFSIIPSQPTLAHPVTRKPSYYLLLLLFHVTAYVKAQSSIKT